MRGYRLDRNLCGSDGNPTMYLKPQKATMNHGPAQSGGQRPLGGTSGLIEVAANHARFWRAANRCGNSAASLLFALGLCAARSMA